MLLARRGVSWIPTTRTAVLSGPIPDVNRQQARIRSPLQIPPGVSQDYQIIGIQKHRNPWGRGVITECNTWACCSGSSGDTVKQNLRNFSFTSRGQHNLVFERARVVAMPCSLREGYWRTHGRLTLDH